jgi:hypothetical protein
VHYLLGVLAKLPIKIRIVVRSDAALKCFGVNGSIKESRRDTQRSNLIAGGPRGTDLVALANHVAGRDMTCALAKPDEKFEG